MTHAPRGYVARFSDVTPRFSGTSFFELFRLVDGAICACSCSSVQWRNAVFFECCLPRICLGVVIWLYIHSKKNIFLRVFLEISLMTKKRSRRGVCVFEKFHPPDGQPRGLGHTKPLENNERHTPKTKIVFGF